MFKCNLLNVIYFYCIFYLEGIDMKKLFLFTVIFSLLIAFNKANAIDKNVSLGIEMYKFSKPRIAKEVTIINVYPNTAAWNAGVRIADRILKVNDIDVSTMSTEEVRDLISTENTVKLTLKTRTGIKDFNIKKDAFWCLFFIWYMTLLCKNEKLF